MSQQMQSTQIPPWGQLVTSIGKIQINNSVTLSIARAYLDVLEKKMKELKVEAEKTENP